MTLRVFHRTARCWKPRYIDTSIQQLAWRFVDSSLISGRQRTMMIPSLEIKTRYVLNRLDLQGRITESETAGSLDQKERLS